MIANVSLLVLYLIRLAYGGLAALLAGSSTLNYDEIQKRFFAEDQTFRNLMQQLSELSDQTFGRNNRTRFVKVNLVLLIFFLMALVWYSYRITGIEFLITFFWRGLTVGLSDNERNYFLYYWPWHYVDLTRNSGRELFVGNQYVEGIILVFILLAVLSVAFSLSIINTLSLVRQCGTAHIRFLGNLLRILGTMCIGILIDVSFFAIFLVTLIVGGNSINVSLQEFYRASASQHWLEYGYQITVGNARLGAAATGVGIIVPNIDLEEVHRSSASSPNWLHRIFPHPHFEDDAGLLCIQDKLESAECADRLRSMYFRHFPSPNGLLEYLVEIVQKLFPSAVSVACGNDAWSPLANGSGFKEGIALAFPWGAALAVTVLSRFLIIPWLVLVLIINHSLVRMGKSAALSSEKGLTFLMQHGRVLLLTSPFIAISIVWVFAQRLC
jgi:hypothetical protein